LSGDVISVRDIVAGILIGAANQSWAAVFIVSIAWGFVAWGYVALVTGRADYKPGTVLFFRSPALTRFIVWWTTAVATSLAFASIIYGVRQFLA
jgi:hypothetical protein